MAQPCLEQRCLRETKISRAREIPQCGLRAEKSVKQPCVSKWIGRPDQIKIRRSKISEGVWRVPSPGSKMEGAKAMFLHGHPSFRFQAEID